MLLSYSVPYYIWTCTFECIYMSALIAVKRMRERIKKKFDGMQPYGKLFAFALKATALMASFSVLCW